MKTLLQVFESLMPIAVCELCDAADALMLPVRLNYVKPTAPFPLTHAHVESCHGCEEMFEVEPLQRHQPQPTSTQPTAGNANGTGDDDEETEEEGPPPSGSRSSAASASASRSRRRGHLIIPSQQEHHENEG